MKNFKKQGNRSGGGKFGRKKFGKGGFGGNSRRGDSQMHDATCSKCGNDCQVPFRPTGEKPVFCSACFDQERGITSERGERNFDRKDRRESHSERRDHEAPRQCESNKKTEEFNREQFASLHAKLDELITLLTEAASVETPELKEVKTATPKKATKKTATPKKTTKTKKATPKKAATKKSKSK